MLQWTSPRLVVSLPHGSRVENIGRYMGMRMVTVLMPPRSIRPVILLAGERELGDLNHTEYRRASKCPRITLRRFTNSIPWRNGDDLVKEMPPANAFLGPRVFTPPALGVPLPEKISSVPPAGATCREKGYNH